VCLRPFAVCSSTDTLPPFPCGRLSRPRSTTTAPPHPPLSVGIEPIHRSRVWPTRSLERQTNGSHVHCCSVDGLGTRLYPCGLAMATPWTFTMASRTERNKPSRELPTTPEITGTAGAHRTPAHIHRVRAGQVSRGVTTPVPRVYLSVSLTGPDPSGSPEPTRLCRGCSHLPRRSPDRLPPASPHRHDGRAPKVSHLHPPQQRLVAHVAASDLPAGACTGPAGGPHVLHQRRRAPRTAA
jgi:hypothetical protein